MGRFYSANFSAPTSAILNELESAKENSMRSLAFVEFNNIGGGYWYYNIGDKMASRVETEFEGSTDTSPRRQYRDAFPLPRADSYGNCNNFGSAYFMLDDSSHC